MRAVRKANGSHRAARPDRLNRFSAWLDRTDGLHLARAIHPREADLTLPSPAHRKVHRRQLSTRRYRINSGCSIRPRSRAAKARCSGTRLANWRVFSNTIMRPCTESKTRMRLSLVSIPVRRSKSACCWPSPVRSKVFHLRLGMPGSSSACTRACVVRIKS